MTLLRFALPLLAALPRRLRRRSVSRRLLPPARRPAFRARRHAQRRHSGVSLPAPPRRAARAWENAICHLDAWVAGDEDGKPYLEQHEVNARARLRTPSSSPAIRSGATTPSRSRVRPLSTGRYGRHRLPLPHQPPLLPVRAHRRQPRAAGRAPAPGEATARRRVEGAGVGRVPLRHAALLHALASRTKARTSAPRSTASWCSRPRTARFSRAARASPPTSPRASSTSACDSSDAVEDRHRRPHRRREAELARLRDSNPRPKLWKKFDTPSFGAGRNVRFGDLDGDGAHRHADRAEHPARARRRLRRHQLPDRRQPRRQGALADAAGPIRATACSPTTRRFRSTTSTATAATKSCWCATSSCRSSTAAPAR